MFQSESTTSTEGVDTVLAANDQTLSQPAGTYISFYVGQDARYHVA